MEQVSTPSESPAYLGVIMDAGFLPTEPDDLPTDLGWLASPARRRIASRATE